MTAQATSTTLMSVNLSDMNKLLQQAGFSSEGQLTSQDDLEQVFSYSSLLTTLLAQFAQLQTLLLKTNHNIERALGIKERAEAAKQSFTPKSMAYEDFKKIQSDATAELKANYASIPQLKKTMALLAEKAHECIQALSEKNKALLPQLLSYQNKELPADQMAVLEELACILNTEKVIDMLKERGIEVPESQHHWDCIAVLLEGMSQEVL